jgi:hypothetical protein
MPKSRFSWASATVILAIAATGLTQSCTRSPSAPAASHSTGTNGCAPDRPAIAHRVGGVKVENPQAKEAPVPCITKTGMRTGEATIVVTKAGTVLFRPAWNSETPGPVQGIIRSTDGGASWETPNSIAQDTNMWTDRQTGRVFWLVIGIHLSNFSIPSRLEISDDDGKTWYPGGQPLAFDHMQIFGGPPTASMKSLLQGYPNVVYACMGHKPLKCQKSQDGGKTWGPELDIPYPPGLEAIQGPAHDCSAFGLQGVVDKDGTVIVPYGPCNRPYVAISHDEGRNWQLVAVANTDEIGYGYPSLGLDEAGNLYAAWVGATDRLPYVAISSDHGLHWGTPLMVAAPGVNEAAIPYLVAGARGQVAVAYYASKNAPSPFPPPCFPVPEGPRPATFATPNRGPTLSSCPGYENQTWETDVTETWDALDAQPLFWSAALNSPTQPTWYGCSPSEIGVIRWDENFNHGRSHYRGCYPRLVLDYYGATMAPDGTVWVGLAQGCPYGSSTGNPNCPSTGPDAGGLFGLVGRLAPPGHIPGQ